MMAQDLVAILRGLCDGLVREPHLTIDYPRWLEEQLAEIAAPPTQPGPPPTSDPAADLEAVHAVLDEFDPTARKALESTPERVRRVITIYTRHRGRRR